MTRNLLFIFLFFSSFHLFAQTDPASRISLSAVVTDDPKYAPVETRTLLKNKLLEVATQNGLAAGAGGRFLITASQTTLEKNVTNSAPAQVLYEIQFNFYIADAVDNIVFASSTITTKGAGSTEERALMNAVRQINAKHKDLQEMVENGKRKILAYYSEQCDNNIAAAQSLANQFRYEEALQLLNQIPNSSSSDCYGKAASAAKTIFMAYQDYLCNKNLAKASAAWVSGMDKAAADNAAILLANITPDAKCYADAQKLVEDIRSRNLELWNFELKKYDATVDITKQWINAWKDIGVAYGSNQPDKTVDITWIFAR